MRRDVPRGATMPDQLSICASGKPSSAIAGTRGVTVAQAPTRVGSEGAHLRVIVRQGETYRQAFGRGLGDRIAEAPAGATLDIAFEPHVGHWQGRDTLEVHLRDFRPAARAYVKLSRGETPERERSAAAASRTISAVIISQSGAPTRARAITRTTAAEVAWR